MFPVLHSVSYAGAWPGHSCLSVEAFLDKAAELGYRAIALVAKRPHLSPHDYDPAACRNLREAIGARGLSLEALMGYTDFTCAIDRLGIPSAEMNAAYVGTLAQLAAELGAPRLRIFSGYERAGVAYETQYTELVRGLRMASRAAGPFPVTLLLQNHHDLAVHHTQLAWLMRELDAPNIKLAFDAWAPFLQGLSGDAMKEAVRAVAPWIAWTTVADYQRQPRFLYHPDVVNYSRHPQDLLRAMPCGAGEVDYASFFAALREINYTGPVAYEMCAVLEGGGSVNNLDAAARTFLKWLAGFVKPVPRRRKSR